MDSQKKKHKKQLSETQKKSMWTFFTLLFPSLLMAIILSFARTTEIVIIGILLFFYQSVLLKDFVEKYYLVA